MIDFEPGFFMGTATGVKPVSYINIPPVKIVSARIFEKKMVNLKPGQRLFGEFQRRDESIFNRLKGRNR
jgi:hypothetical protein